MDQEMQSMWRTTQLGPRAPRGTLGTVLKTDGQGRLCLIKGGWLGPTAQGPWARGSVRNAPVSAPNLTPFAKLATFPRFLLRHSGPSQWGRAHSGAATAPLTHTSSRYLPRRRRSAPMPFTAPPPARTHCPFLVLLSHCAGSPRSILSIMLTCVSSLPTREQTPRWQAPGPSWSPNTLPDNGRQ